MTIEEMMKSIPTPQSNMGNKFCNAIDEDVYDSSDWSNNMPSDGYNFYQEDNGTVHVTYDYHFACYDGWDSMTNDIGVYDSMEDAVRTIYIEITNELFAERAARKLKKFEKKVLKALRSNTGNYHAELIMLKLFHTELRFI